MQSFTHIKHCDIQNTVPIRQSLYGLSIWSRASAGTSFAEENSFYHSFCQRTERGSLEHCIGHARSSFSVFGISAPLPWMKRV